MFTKTELNLVKSVDRGTLNLGDLSNDLQQKLFDFFMPSMPYGVAKARTGDPDQFIYDHLSEIVG